MPTETAMEIANLQGQIMALLEVQIQIQEKLNKLEKQKERLEKQHE